MEELINLLNSLPSAIDEQGLQALKNHEQEFLKDFGKKFLLQVNFM